MRGLQYTQMKKIFEPKQTYLFIQFFHELCDLPSHCVWSPLWKASFLPKQWRLGILALAELGALRICFLSWLYFLHFCPVALRAEVQLDALKQKGAIKRTLFLENHQPHHFFPLVIKRQKSLQCQDFMVYLRVSAAKTYLLIFQVQIQVPTILSNHLLYLSLSYQISFYSFSFPQEGTLF